MLINNTDSIIFTAQPEAAVLALNEIQKQDSGARLLEILSPEARLVSLPGGYSALLARIKENPPIFIRHIFPVQYVGKASAWDYEKFLPPPNTASFSVQMRSVPKSEDALNIVRLCETFYTARGYKQDDKNPSWVLSLFICKDYLYAGISETANNLSAWNGGAMRFKKDERFISRAEFKLLEAFATFSITQNENLHALDLGAAPGGWTKVLLERGYHVTAVDPAVLHESLAGHPKLTVINDVVQRLKETDKRYNLIVNDMRMDYMDSARIMLDMADRLTGKAVMTLKLSRGHWYQKTTKALNLLQKKYRILAVRQLFHNRDEVTVYLEKEI